MPTVNQKAFIGFVQMIIALAVSLFLPAWSLVYTQAWLFLAAFFIPVLAITLYLVKKDPGLLARRVDAGAPVWITLAGDMLVIVGLLIVFLAFRENSFASATIEVYALQKIISTGPYSLVRHPMYTGALVMLAGTPLALGSWWGLIPVIAVMLVIGWRLLEEETFLAKNLPAYSSYRERVKYRLIPLIW